MARFYNGVEAIRTVPLGLPELTGPHSGENIAELVQRVIHDYSIASKVAYFVLDNAYTNDVAVKIVLDDLPRPQPSSETTSKNTSEDLAETYRLRCAGRTVNLVAQAFMHGVYEGVRPQ